MLGAKLNKNRNKSTDRLDKSKSRESKVSVI
jgi:hypothetical protein